MEVQHMNNQKIQPNPSQMVQVVNLTALLSHPYDIKVVTYPEVWDAIPDDGKQSIEECVAEIVAVIECTLSSRVHLLGEEAAVDLGYSESATTHDP